ncbi:MAG TPA: DUF885 family protein, partial [Thermoanaerobaculia bacterium]|nr:DUF885 family protein [Thermoanaerobaculia bacterium]
MKRILAVLILCLPLLAAAKPAAKPRTAAQKLAAVLAEYDKLLLDREPTIRMQRGLDVEKLPELSFEAAQKDARALRALRQRLESIAPQRLTHEEWLSREILDWQLATYAEGADHFWDFFQVTPYASPFRSSLHQVFTSFTFRTEKDQHRYLDLLRQYVRVVGQLRANLETQRAKGIVLPKAEIDPVVGLIRSFVRRPEESLFWVDSKRLQKFYPEGAVAFQGEVRKRIETQVNPALEALAAVPDAKAYRD